MASNFFPPSRGVTFENCTFTAAKPKRKRYLKLLGLRIPYDDIVSVDVDAINREIDVHGHVKYLTHGYDVMVRTATTMISFKSEKVPEEILKWNRYMQKKAR